jgi:hypothetical protein
VPPQGRHVFDLDPNALVEGAFGWLQCGDHLTSSPGIGKEP